MKKSENSVLTASSQYLQTAALKVVYIFFRVWIPTMREEYLNLWLTQLAEKTPHNISL